MIETPTHIVPTATIVVPVDRQRKVATVEDIDLACVTGLGMQVRLGEEWIAMGPLAYADRVGKDVLLGRFRELEARLGRRFRPASILKTIGES